MEKSIRDLWWIPVVRGVSAIAFGILLLVWPHAAIGIVALLFASTFVVYGISDIIVGLQTMVHSFHGILRLLLGFLQLGIVAVLFKNAGSGLTLDLMGLLMAVALIMLAIVMVSSAVLSEGSAGFRWAFAIGGIVTLMIGITVARAPAISISTLIWVLGIYGLFIGPLEIAAGLMIKNNPVLPE